MYRRPYHAALTGAGATELEKPPGRVVAGPAISLAVFGQRWRPTPYVDIFETKGLEYLLLICFLVLFVLLVKYLEGPPRVD